MDKQIFLLLLCLGLSWALKWRIEPTCDIPPERGGHRLVNIDNELIVLWGGFFECFDVNANCDHIFHDDLWHYDLYNEKWKFINVTGPKPNPRTFFAANLWESQSLVIIYGGIRYNVSLTLFVPFGDIWSYDAYTKTWEEINATNSGPGARIAPNVAIYKNDMYVFGGLTPSFQIVNDFWKFNLVNRTWTLIHPNGTAGTPQPTYLGSFRLDKERKQFVLYGGNILVPASGTQTNETWLYSIQNNTWTQVVTPFLGRIHNSAEVVDDQFVVAFGDVQNLPNEENKCVTPEASSGQKPTDEVWSLNLLNNTWTQLEVKCSKPKKRTASTRVRRRIFDWGGFDYKCPFGAPGFPLWDNELRSLRINDDDE